VRVVAIDGPVGSGKSTVARAVGARLGLDVLETGAMYRAVAVAALRRGVPLDDSSPETAEQLARVARDVAVEVGERVTVDGEDVTDEIRTPAVNRAVSAVAANPEVRAALVARQRAWAEARGGGVVEGRDIGTVVFPDAPVKVFLTASEEERARRRGADEGAADLARRDRLDSTRATSPLVAAPDALLIDSTGRTVEDIVEQIVAAANPSPRAAPAAPPPPSSSPSPPPSDRPDPDFDSTPKPMILYRTCWYILWVLMRLYWRVTYEGREHVPTDEPFILAPAHRSFLDFALVSGLTRRRLCYMAKDSIWKYPFFNRFLYALGAFPVHREGTDREALRRCMAVLQQRREPLVLFPEGTRRSGPIIEHLHEGAAYLATRTGAPIVPVGIGGSGRALQKGQRVPRPVKVHIVAGPPIRPPAPAPGATRTSRRAVHQLTEELQAEVQRLFDLAQKRAGVD
jgi:cytidylate kinase